MKRRIDDVLSTPSHACSINTRQKLNSSEQCHDNNKKNYEREDSLGWKPLNKGNNTFERFYSQSNRKGRDKNKNILETGVKNVIEETRKRPRLNWGEGLAKFDKKKIEGDGVSVATAATPASGAFNSFTGILLDSINYSLSYPNSVRGPLLFSGYLALGLLGSRNLL